MPCGEPIIYEPGGYRQQMITLNIGIKDITPEHLSNINNWLSGSGKLIFSNDPDKHYLAIANNAMTGNRLIERFGKIPVQFLLMPFKRENESDWVEIPLSNHVGWINDATAAQLQASRPSRCTATVTLDSGTWHPARLSRCIMCLNTV